MLLPNSMLFKGYTSHNLLFMSEKKVLILSAGFCFIVWKNKKTLLAYMQYLLLDFLRVI